VISVGSVVKKINNLAVHNIVLAIIIVDFFYHRAHRDHRERKLTFFILRQIVFDEVFQDEFEIVHILFNIEALLILC